MVAGIVHQQIGRNIFRLFGPAETYMVFCLLWDLISYRWKHWQGSAYQANYLSRTSTEVTQRPLPTSVSPTPSVASSATVRPRAPGIDREAPVRSRIRIFPRDFNPIHTNPYFAAFSSLPGAITLGMFTSAVTGWYVETV